MAEYIERGAAKRAIFDYICGHYMSKFPSKEILDASKKGAEGAFNEIDYVPTADVVEVRHGEWEMRMYNEHCSCGKSRKVARYECSVCKRIADMQPYGLSYCPNCGAKMDGKGEGE